MVIAQKMLFTLPQQKKQWRINMKKLFELFDDSKNNDKPRNRKKQIIKDAVKDSIKNKLSGKKDVFDPEPDLNSSEVVK